MKYLIILSLTVLFACKNRQEAKAIDTPHKDSTTESKAGQNFTGINFASKMDLACGMLLTAGIQDTAHYKGKIYGFCSADCKKEFLQTPEAFLASKYRH